MKTVVIIPTYNEAANVESITAAVRAAAPDADVLVVDDCSPDGTGQIADRIAAGSGGRVHVLHRSEKKGLGAAYLDAYHWALERGFGRVATMDADFSHDPAYLPEMMRRADSADVVIGSRYVPGGGVRNWSLLRRCVSRWGGAYARLVLGLPVRDATAGFGLFSRRAIEIVLQSAPVTSGYGFQVEQKYVAARAGLRLVEIPIVFVDRRAGQSKMSAGIAFEALWRVWTFRFRRKRPDGSETVGGARTEA